MAHALASGIEQRHNVVGGEIGVGGDPIVDGRGATSKKPASTSLVAPSRQ